MGKPHNFVFVGISPVDKLQVDECLYCSRFIKRGETYSDDCPGYKVFD